MRDREHVRAELRVQPGVPRRLELVPAPKKVRFREPVAFVNRDALPLHKAYRRRALVCRVEPWPKG